MNDLISIKIGDVSIKDIIESPDNYPEEVIAAAYDVVNEMNKYIRVTKQTVEQILIQRMKEDMATKLIFLDGDRNERVATLKKGEMKLDCKDTNAELMIKAAGFDPLKFGDYKYVPSWSKSREIGKLGKGLQTVVDLIFREGPESIKID